MMASYDAAEVRRPAEGLVRLVLIVTGVLVCASLFAYPPNGGPDRADRPGGEDPQGGLTSKRADETQDPWPDEEVPYIITEWERAEFKSLSSPQQREQFIQKFWDRRNPDPGSSTNKFRDEYYRRVAYVKQRFHYLDPTTKDDRSRIYIQFGPPAKIEFPQRRSGHAGPGASKQNDASAPVERWTYLFIEGIGQNVDVDFVDPTGSGERQVVVDPVTLIDHTPSAANNTANH